MSDQASRVWITNGALGAWLVNRRERGAWTSGAVVVVVSRARSPTATSRWPGEGDPPVDGSTSAGPDARHRGDARRSPAPVELRCRLHTGLRRAARR